MPNMWVAPILPYYLPSKFEHVLHCWKIFIKSRTLQLAFWHSHTCTNGTDLLLLNSHMHYFLHSQSLSINVQVCDYIQQVLVKIHEGIMLRKRQEGHNLVSLAMTHCRKFDRSVRHRISVTAQLCQCRGSSPTRSAGCYGSMQARTGWGGHANPHPAASCGLFFMVP